MRLNLLMIGLLMMLTACANPEVSQLHADGEGDGSVQKSCGRFIVPNVVEMAGITATGFGVPIESVTLEGLDCLKDGSLALNAFTEHQQFVVNGAPVQLYTRDNQLLAVAGEEIVGQRELQEESYGKELSPTGRWILPVDENTLAQGDVLSWAL